MTFEFYRALHFLGIILIFLSLGGLVVHAANGGTKESNRWRKPVAITHGIGMLIALTGGFGMLAKLGIFWPWPGWAIGKLIVWLLLGAMVAPIYRRGDSALLWWVFSAILGFTAAYLAVFKPI